MAELLAILLLGFTILVLSHRIEKLRRRVSNLEDNHFNHSHGAYYAMSTTTEIDHG